MIEHIVKNNEGIDEILEAYHISLNELKEYNRHITDFNNLVCGLKLKVPYLKEETEQILEGTEVFVEKYYKNVVDAFDEEEREEYSTPLDELVEEKNENEEISEIEVEKNNNTDIKQNERIDEKILNTVKYERVILPPKGNPKIIAYPGITPPKRPYGGIKFIKK